MNMRLHGLTAMVTGAGSGIGRAVAVRLAREGANVGILDRNPAGLAETARLIRESGGSCLLIQADVSNADQMEASVGEVVSAFGGLEIIAAVAGIELADAGDGRVHELALDAWQRTLDTNLTGMFLTLKYGIAGILSTGNGGSVIITGSPCGLYGACSDQHAYSASKSGAHGLVRPLAADYAADGIRVNCVVPGFIDTPLTASFVADPVFLAEICGRIPMRRPGKAEEVANMFAWLASSEASYVTGAFFFADGGQTAI